LEPKITVDPGHGTISTPTRSHLPLLVTPDPRTHLTLTLTFLPTFPIVCSGLSIQHLPLQSLHNPVFTRGSATSVSPCSLVTHSCGRGCQEKHSGRRKLPSESNDIRDEGIDRLLYYQIGRLIRPRKFDNGGGISLSITLSSEVARKLQLHTLMAILCFTFTSHPFVIRYFGSFISFPYPCPYPCPSISSIPFTLCPLLTP
jgi:hypothetical protein